MCHPQVKYDLVGLVFVLYVCMYVSIVVRCDLFLPVDRSQDFEKQCCQDAYVAHREITAMERDCIMK